MAKRIIQITISIVLLAVLFVGVDVGQIKSTLIQAKYHFLALAFVVVTFNRVIMSYKWGLLLRVKQIKLSLYELTKIYYIANFLGLFLPATVGTDVVRSYYISRKTAKNNPLPDVVASMVMERVLGFLAIFVASIIGIVMLLDVLQTTNLNYYKLFVIMCLVTVGFSVFLIISLNDRFLKNTQTFADKIRHKKFMKKFGPQLKNLAVSYHSYKQYKGVLFVFFVLTFGEITTVIIWSYLVALALNAAVPFAYFAAFIPIITVLSRLPISLDGFGIHEGGFVYFLSLAGISKSLGFGVGLINHITTIIGILPGWFFWITERDRNLVKVIDVKINE